MDAPVKDKSEPAIAAEPSNDDESDGRISAGSDTATAGSDTTTTKVQTPGSDSSHTLLADTDMRSPEVQAMLAQLRPAAAGDRSGLQPSQLDFSVPIDGYSPPVERLAAGPNDAVTAQQVAETQQPADGEARLRTLETMASGVPREMLDAAVRNSAGRFSEAELRDISARIAVWNALPPDLRQRLGGPEQPIDPRQVIGQLANGTLQDSNNRILLTDVEKAVREEQGIVQYNLGEDRDVRRISEDRIYNATYQLGGMTMDGVSFWSRLAFWNDTPGHFERRQNDLLRTLSREQQYVNNANERILEGSVTDQTLTLSLQAGDYSRMISEGRTQDAERLALQMWGSYGSTLQRLAPQVWRALADNPDLPHFEIGTTNGVAQGYAALRNLPTDGTNPELTNAIRTQAMAAIDSDPTMRELYRGSSVIARELPVLREMFETGLNGTKYEDFVANARERAATIQQALRDGGQHVPAMRQQIEQMRAEQASMTDTAAKDALRQRIEMLERTANLFDPQSQQNQQLRNILETVGSSQFDANTFGNWLRTNGVIIGAAIGTAALAVATVASFGATSPLLFAAGGALGALVGTEVAREGLYQGDVLHGPNQRSRLGSYLAGEQQFDATTSQYRDRGLLGNVVAPYARDAAVNFGLTLATMGLGLVASRAINEALSRMGQRAASQFVVDNAQLLQQLRTRTTQLENAAANPGQNTWLRTFLRESADEAADSVKEGATQQVLQSMLTNMDSATGFASSLIVATGKGIRFNHVSNSNHFTYASDSPTALRDLTLQLRQDGHQVTVNEANGMLRVRSFGGREYVLRPENAAAQTDTTRTDTTRVPADRTQTDTPDAPTGPLRLEQDTRQYLSERYQMTPEQVDTAVREINQNAENPRDVMTRLMRENRVLSVGEQHRGDVSIRDLGIRTFADLRAAGATHLAVELPANIQPIINDFMQTGDISNLNLWFSTSDNMRGLADLFIAARSAGLQIVAVDYNLVKNEQGQYVRGGTPAERDQAMADGVSRILDQDANHRVVFWAGLSHHADNPPSAGPPTASTILRQRYSVATIATVDDTMAGMMNNPIADMTNGIDRPVALSMRNAPTVANLPHHVDNRLEDDSVYRLPLRRWDYQFIFPPPLEIRPNP